MKKYLKIDSWGGIRINFEEVRRRSDEDVRLDIGRGVNVIEIKIKEDNLEFIENCKLEIGKVNKLIESKDVNCFVELKKLVNKIYREVGVVEIYK